MDLVLFLFYLYFGFYFTFFNCKEYIMILCVTVTQVTKHDRGVKHVTHITVTDYTII